MMEFNGKFFQLNSMHFLISALFISILFIFPTTSELPDLKHNPWELIIYRPENSHQINEIRCYLKIEDENGNDVSGAKVSATYEWISNPDVINNYKKSYYLLGGMAAHLRLKPGKYRFSVFTPEKELVNFSGKAKEEWQSNIFEYDTENPAKVIFVIPEADDNGFYSGRWRIDYKAPKWFKFTKPYD